LSSISTSAWSTMTFRSASVSVPAVAVKSRRGTDFGIGASPDPNCTTSSAGSESSVGTTFASSGARRGARTSTWLLTVMRQA
jgi:hypothetical protein